MVSNEIIGDLQTPCFVIDQRDLDENCDSLIEALRTEWGGSAVGYSVKTNSLPWILRYMKEKGCLAEVVSADEYDLARECGFEAQEIILNGPVKGMPQFEECVLAGGIVNLDSNREVEWVKNLSSQVMGQIKVGLRVNFDIDAVLPDDIGCAPYGTRFGFSVETGALRRAIASLGECENIKIAGLHMHSTSKTRSVAVYETLAEAALMLIREYGFELDYLDIGGGFFGGVPGKPTFADYVSAIARVFDGTDIPKKTSLIVEPGSALIASPVSFVSSVIDVKEVARARVVVLDGGRPNVDPLHIKHSYMYRVLSDSDTHHDEQVVAGYTCMETDRLMVLRNEKELRIGDKVAFDRVGSYTMTLSPLFISWFPDVYVVSEAGARLVRRRWKTRDFVRIGDCCDG